MPTVTPGPARPRVMQRLFLSRATCGFDASQLTPFSCTLGGESGVDREVVFRQLTPLINRLMRQFGDDPETRGDLIAELYCRFVKYLEAYDPARGVPLRPYLINSLTISAFNYARSCRIRKRRELLLDDQQTRSNADQGFDPTPTWDLMMDAEQDRRILAAALRRLSERQRRVVIWRYYDELPFAEIAERLRIREATARSTLRKALHNLRQWLVNGGFLE